MVVTTPTERDLLTGHHRPIVLLPRRDGSTRRGLRRGRPRQSRPRRDARRTRPCTTCCSGDRPGARDDQRQPCRRTDRHRRRGRPRAAGGPGRRLAHPRPADPRALRRLGGARRRRRAAPGPSLPGLRAAAAAPAVHDRAGARGRRATSRTPSVSPRADWPGCRPTSATWTTTAPSRRSTPPSSTSRGSPASRPRRWSPTRTRRTAPPPGPAPTPAAGRSA